MHLERILDKLVGLRLRCLVNSPRLSSGILHRQALRAVGAEADGSGAFMFDVGAHLGETSIALALEFPKAAIHAFEPVEAIFKRLQWNCRKYPNVICHHAALGATNETRTVALHSNELACGMNRMSSLANEETPSELREQITILRVDDICRQFSVGQIAFLKIDVEGFEVQVLRGATEMLKAGRIQTIIAEATFSKTDEQHAQFDDICEMLEPFGFVLSGYYDPTYRPESGRLDFSNFLFTLKEEQETANQKHHGRQPVDKES